MEIYKLEYYNCKLEVHFLLLEPASNHQNILCQGNFYTGKCPHISFKNMLLL